jgi:hypothetical protein
MPEQKTIVAIEDLLAVEPQQLSNCLRMLQAWVLRTRRLVAHAEQQGVDPAMLVLEPFRWSPRETRAREATAAPVGLDTPVEDLGLRRAAVFEMRERNLVCLEDFALASEDELLAMKDVGQTSVEHLRRLLGEHGLGFRESDHPLHAAHAQAEIAHKTPAAQRCVSDASSISQLGLRPATVTRCLERHIDTVGALRAMTLRELWGKFGKITLRELVLTLRGVGLELNEAPDQWALWKFGVLEPDALTRPHDEDVVRNLAPWVGMSVVKALERAGVATVGAARDVSTGLGRGDAMRVSGLGETGSSRLREFFGGGRAVHTQAKAAQTLLPWPR